MSGRRRSRGGPQWGTAVQQYTTTTTVGKLVCWYAGTRLDSTRLRPQGIQGDMDISSTGAPPRRRTTVLAAHQDSPTIQSQSTYLPPHHLPPRRPLVRAYRRKIRNPIVSKPSVSDARARPAPATLEALALLSPIPNPTSQDLKPRAPSLWRRDAQTIFVLDGAVGLTTLVSRRTRRGKQAPSSCRAAAPREATTTISCSWALRCCAVVRWTGWVSERVRHDVRVYFLVHWYTTSERGCSLWF